PRTVGPAAAIAAGATPAPPTSSAGCFVASYLDRCSLLLLVDRDRPGRIKFEWCALRLPSPERRDDFAVHAIHAQPGHERDAYRSRELTSSRRRENKLKSIGRSRRSAR